MKARNKKVAFFSAKRTVKEITDEEFHRTWESTITERKSTENQERAIFLTFIE